MDPETDRDRQTQAYRQTDRQAGRQTDTHTLTGGRTDRSQGCVVVKRLNSL